MLCIVFPQVAESQTTNNDEINPKIEFLQEPDPQDSLALYLEWKQTSYSSCVLFAKRITGYVGTVGAARNWSKNSKIPIVGGVVVLNEGKYGHVAVITAVSEDSFTVVEVNYIPNKKSTRTINNADKAILGFWQPNL